MPNTALLVIDIQRGAFDAVRCPPIDQPELLIDAACQLLSAARSSGVPVVFIQHNDVKGEVFEEGSAHWALHEALAPQPGETVLSKYQSSAFEGTDLARVLGELEADHLVLCGLQSEHCVSNTTKSALARGFQVTVAHDGHSTWPWDGKSPGEIKARVNSELAQAGARLRSVAELAGSIREAGR